MKYKTKAKIYIATICLLTIVASLILAKAVTNDLIKYILTTIILIIPISEFVTQIIQYILGKIVKPKLIPKMDFVNGISQENSTFVVIPTIIKTRENFKGVADGVVAALVASDKSPMIGVSIIDLTSFTIVSTSAIIGHLLYLQECTNHRCQ